MLAQAPSGQALVFCKTKRGVGSRGRASRTREGIRDGGDSRQQGSGRPQPRRSRDFKAGRVNVLVATDIAARGLDIVQLPLVVNYDLPLVAEDYVHRVGRTGRAGLAGRAVSFVTASDGQLLRDIQRLLPSPVEHVVVEGFQTSNAPSPARARTQRPRPSGHARSSGRRFSGSPRPGQAALAQVG